MRIWSRRCWFNSHAGIIANLRLYGDKKNFNLFESTHQKGSHCYMSWHLRGIFYPCISTRLSSNPHTSRVTRCFTGRPLNTVSPRGSGASWRYAPRGKTGWWSVSWREDPSTSSKSVPSLMSSREPTVRWRWSGHWKKVNVRKLLFYGMECIYK